MDDDDDADRTSESTQLQQNSTICQSSDLIVSDLFDIPVKYELLRDDLERLKNHLQGSHQEALATVIAHAAQFKSPEFRVPFSSTSLSKTTMITPPVNVDGSESLSGSHTDKVATDSYTWRKYGMKQVKSPEGSRSYYKCTYSACDSKKIESCDRFNTIVNIVYKGEHKHDPPKRLMIKKGDLEIEKRLKKNSSSLGDLGCVLKNPKKPKFVVHAAADVELSADGYRWKKYGQKMVKGTPHPRNYYKCTSAGCTVRKHIEKVDDSSEVTITYTGVHDHDMPVPKKGRGPPTATAASKSILQYRRREHLPARVPTNEADRTNESNQTRTLLSVGFEIKHCCEPHLGKL